MLGGATAHWWRLVEVLEIAGERNRYGEVVCVEDHQLVVLLLDQQAKEYVHTGTANQS